MYKKIASNTISQIFSKVWTAIVAIFLLNILRNYFPLDVMWLYEKIYNYVWIFVFLADLWLYAITIREITNNKEKEAFIVWNVMSLRLFLWIFILFLSIFIAYFLPWYNSTLALLSIFISSIFTILQLLNSSILAMMQANMKVEFSAFSLIFWKIVNLFWVFFIAYYFYPKEFIQNSDYFTPFIYIMIVWVISVWINTILNYFYARKITKFWFCFDFNYIKYIFKISIPYWLALFLSVVYFKMDVMMLSIMEWSNENIALYTLPMKIIEVIMVIWWFYMTSMLPSLTKKFKEKNILEVDKIIDISFKVLFMFSSMVFVLWVLFREYIILIVANQKYLDETIRFNSSDAFLVVFSVILFYFISLVFIYTFVASEKQNRLLKINIIVTIFNFLWNLFFIPIFSFIWSWIVTLLSQILLFILWYFWTKDLINFKFPFKFIFINIFFSFIIYYFWYFLLHNFSFKETLKYWLYIDFFGFWFLIFFIYVIFYLIVYKKFLKRFA